MGLRNTIQTKLGAAFSTSLADAITEFTLYRGSNANYNPNSGTLDSTRAISGPSRGAFTQYAQSEINNTSVKPKDTKVISLTNELPFDPEVDDLIITRDCTEYKVINSTKDPASASYEIQCRRG